MYRYIHVASPTGMAWVHLAASGSNPARLVSMQLGLELV